MALAIVALAGFLLTTGWVSLLFLLLFGFALWSSFSVTLAIAHELMPGELGLSSGLLLGSPWASVAWESLAIGSLADTIGLAGALSSLILPLAAATVLMAVLPYRGGRPGQDPPVIPLILCLSLRRNASNVAFEGWMGSGSGLESHSCREQRGQPAQKI